MKHLFDYLLRFLAKYLTTHNFAIALAVTAIRECVIECIHLPDEQKVTMIMLTVGEICFLDFFMKKSDDRATGR